MDNSPKLWFQCYPTATDTAPVIGFHTQLRDLGLEESFLEQALLGWLGEKEENYELRIILLLQALPPIDPLHIAPLHPLVLLPQPRLLLLVPDIELLVLQT